MHILQCYSLLYIFPHVIVQTVKLSVIYKGETVCKFLIFYLRLFLLENMLNLNRISSISLMWKLVDSRGDIWMCILPLIIFFRLSSSILELTVSAHPPFSSRILPHSKFSRILSVAETETMFENEWIDWNLIERW